MKKKPKSGGIPLPLKPEPFVYRLEVDPEAHWTITALAEVLTFSTLIQLEAFKGLSDHLLQLVQYLDGHQRDFKLRLILSSEEKSFDRFIKPLSKLKKSFFLLFLVNLNPENPSLTKNQKDKLKTMLIAFSSAGLKTGLMLELSSDSDMEISDIENLIISARQAGALEIFLRPSLFPSNQPKFENLNGADFIDFLTRLNAGGFPLTLEECFPGTWPDLGGLSLNCRQAFGSCFVDRNGLVKPCRLSETVLGDLKQRPLKDIFSEYIFSRRQYCFFASAQLKKNEFSYSLDPEFASALTKNQNSFSAIDSGPTHPSTHTPFPDQASGLTSPTASFASPEAAPSTGPVILDSSLKPVPLFRLLDRPWGATLVHQYDGLILTHKGAGTARFIDGRHNLRWFKKKFGDKILSLIYGLFLKGYLRLEK
ncbi:MAG: SPASM domain-containing protein [Candidatus Saccharicenans sp.]|uniref:SPASM domain-containing protein n=1 Tax=Candidatus Saccharicenans sp. TaxID=2819258 RepID=UPI00404A305F